MTECSVVSVSNNDSSSKQLYDQVMDRMSYLFWWMASTMSVDWTLVWPENAEKGQWICQVGKHKATGVTPLDAAMNLIINVSAKGDK